IAQLLPASDGSFTTTFKVTGPLWKDAGNYTIITNYGRYTQANATFYYSGGNGRIIFGEVINDVYHLQAGGVTYDIPYIIKNGASVKSMDVYADKDRKSTRLNSSHVSISYAVFCLKKKK